MSNRLPLKPRYSPQGVLPAGTCQHSYSALWLMSLLITGIIVQASAVRAPHASLACLIPYPQHIKEPSHQVQLQPSGFLICRNMSECGHSSVLLRSSCLYATPELGHFYISEPRYI